MATPTLALIAESAVSCRHLHTPLACVLHLSRSDLFVLLWSCLAARQLL